MIPYLDLLEPRLLPSGAIQPSQGSLRHLYTFDKVPYTGAGHAGRVAGSAGQTIAVIDPYRSPTALQDLTTFSTATNLPTPTLQEKWVGKSQPLATDNPLVVAGGWQGETAADIEWAHAMAPGARLLLIEAASNSLQDLLTAAYVAARQPGVSVITMSWGGDEFKGEATYDHYFVQPPHHPPVTFVISSGDFSAVPQYPAVSPGVVSVGGTVMHTTPQGDYAYETPAPSGGGPAKWELSPSPREIKRGVLPPLHSSPLVVMIASDVGVYSTADKGWNSWGGTSLSAPMFAGLVTIADQDRMVHHKPPLSTSQVVSAVASAPADCFHQIKDATPTVDYMGRGSPIAVNLVSWLAR